MGCHCLLRAKTLFTVILVRFFHWGFPQSLVGKESACNAETPVQFLGREDPLEKGKATHSSILAWRIPWTVESMALQRVGHD